MTPNTRDNEGKINNGGRNNGHCDHADADAITITDAFSVVQLV